MSVYVSKVPPSSLLLKYTEQIQFWHVFHKNYGIFTLYHGRRYLGSPNHFSPTLFIVQLTQLFCYLNPTLMLLHDLMPQNGYNTVANLTSFGRY